MSDQGWGQPPGGWGQGPGGQGQGGQGPGGQGPGGHHGGGGFGQAPHAGPGGFGQAPPVGGFGPAGPDGGYRAPGYIPPAQLTEQERMWGMLAHFSTFVVGIFGPVILMMVDIGGAPSPFVKHHAKQAMLWSVAMIVVAVLTCGIGAFVMMIWQVLAGVAANRGEWYVYPGLSSFVDPQQ